MYELTTLIKYSYLKKVVFLLNKKVSLAHYICEYGSLVRKCDPLIHMVNKGQCAFLENWVALKRAFGEGE